MNTSRLPLLLVLAIALVFAAVGLEFWFAPEQAAMRFGIEAIEADGLTTLRADVGGLFAGLSILCGVAVLRRRASWAGAAAAVLGAVMVGRAIGGLAGGPTWQSLIELGIELGAMVALLAYAHSLTPPAPAGAIPPKRKAWLVAGSAFLLAIAGVAAVSCNPKVEQALYDKGAEAKTAEVNTAPLVDDALRVAVCGSSAPLPDPDRAKACVAVFAGGKFYVVDSGPESTENLVLWGIPLSSIGGVMITHFHSDHIGDLGELHLQTWAGGRAEKLAVYGGPGIDRVVDGFNRAYAQDQVYRTTHHGEKVMPSKTWGMVAHTVELDGPPTPAKDRTGLVFDDGALRVTAIEVDHAPISPAYAYRFDYKGRSVVITGDLKYHPPLIKSAADADVLISEAISKTMTQSLQNAARAAGRERTAAIMHDIEDYHITPEEAASIANDAHVKLLVYYHLLPTPTGRIARDLFTQGVDKARHGAWTIADDGSLYTLPLGSKEVRIGKVSG